jgi:type IV pilus assembly protein PilC
MALYQYKGVDRSGKAVSGQLEAQSEGEMRMMLRSAGVRPTKMTRASGGLTLVKKADGSGGNSLNTRSTETLGLAAQLIFTRQLQVLIGAGIPIVQGLELLYEQMSDKNLKSVIGGIKERVSGGMFLWEALTYYPKAFPKLYISLIRAGESSGSIDAILKRLARYLEDADRLRKMLKSAMMYPAIVVCVGIGVIGIMMVFVIPRFETLLTQSGQALPGPTQFVIDVSHFLVKNIVYVLLGIVAGVVALSRFFKTEEGKALLDRALFKAPIFGPIMQKGGIARFSRTMQTLLMSGVNLIDAVDICKSTIDNVVLEDAVGTIRSDIEAGKTLGQVVNKLTVFPRMAVQMITVGESTGNLDKMLEKVADFYEEEVEMLVGGLTKMLEPLILVVLGGSVGFLMIAMYLPIFKLAGSAGQ